MNFRLGLCGLSLACLFVSPILARRAPAEALELAEAALAAHERDSGPNHPWTRDSARVTADALDALGRGEEATGVRARFGIGGGA